MKTNEKTQTAPKAYTTSELFTRMNQVRKSMSLSQKEAFAEAKRQLEEEFRNKQEEELRLKAEADASKRKEEEERRLKADDDRRFSEEAIALKLKTESEHAERILAEKRAMNDACARLLDAMKDSAVKFTFINERGLQSTTTGTLDKERFPKTRMVAGTLNPKNENMFSFYDIRHGVFRQFEQDKLISIDVITVKRGRPAQKKETAVLEPA